MEDFEAYLDYQYEVVRPVFLNKLKEYLEPFYIDNIENFFYS